MLDDKYRIERLLATGGMGAVYLGTHTRLHKRVAIKILNPQLSTTPMIERFHREAITASQIGHEGIAQVTDLGNGHDGEPFLVMEYLEGESLASRLRALGPLAIEDACELGCAILSPLGAAHRAGIIHRDLKPDNVFLVRQSRGETVKLLDFGISRTVGRTPELRLTNTGLVLGTPYYMSPEQARGESQITPAADLYAFGVILYEILVGDVPIRADNYNQLMYRVTIGDFDRPRDRRPEIPEALEQIILHAMAQSPEDRPASAADIEQALLAFCRPVFREHANGRISAPGLSFKTPPGGNHVRSSSDDLGDHARFAGPTVSTASDTFRDDLYLPPEEADPPAPADAAPGSGEGAQPALPVSQPVAPPASQPAGPVSQPVVSSGSQPGWPALPPLADAPGPVAAPAPRRSLARRILAGFALVAASAGIAASLVIMLADRDDPPVATPPVSAAPSLPSRPSPPSGPSLPSGHAARSPITQPPADHGASAQLPGDHPATRGSATITLQFAVTPPGAVITLDGARISGPELAVPRDAAPHQLRIRAAGYVGYERTIAFDETQRLIVQLRHTAGPARGTDSRGAEHQSRASTEPPQRPEQPAETGRTDGIELKSPYE